MNDTNPEETTARRLALIGFTVMFLAIPMAAALGLAIRVFLWAAGPALGIFR